jgi:ribonuclease BN (tRNA processing enzyme)
MIGTGSAFTKRYYNTSALVHGSTFKLLIDCGTTAPRSLHELGIEPNQLDGILITHLHADHIGGLEEMAFRLYYSYGRKRVKLFVPETLVQPLWDYSLRGGLEDTVEGLTSLSDYFDVVPHRDGVQHQIAGDLMIEPLRTRHIDGKNSYSLIINDILFYSADMVFSPDLLKHLTEKRGCRHIFHDCQLTPPGIVHTTLDELLTLPEELQRIIYLMHYSDDMEQHAHRAGHMTFLRQHATYVLK